LLSKLLATEMVTGMVLPVELVGYQISSTFEAEVYEPLVRELTETVAPANVTELAIASTEAIMIGAGETGNAGTGQL
jgi:hypothetical protein